MLKDPGVRPGVAVRHWVAGQVDTSKLLQDFEGQVSPGPALSCYGGMLHCQAYGTIVQDTIPVCMAASSATHGPHHQHGSEQSSAQPQTTHGAPCTTRHAPKHR